MECPFCTIEITDPKRIVYKDEMVLAFPTNIPITPGHMLVCPTRHVKKIDELKDDELVAIKNLIVKIKNSLAKSFGVEGFNIAWNEGGVAGQAVDHLHLHIVPRKEGDRGVYEYEPRKFLYRPGSREQSSEKELEAVAKLIRKNI